MRAQGIKSRICGLSANDMEQKFLTAGADLFLQKPFPCKPDELRKELIRILHFERPEHVQYLLDRVARRNTCSTIGMDGSEGSTKDY